mgnify:FL=1
MEGFLHAVSSVTIILLLTATGYFCAERGWMGPQAKAFIGKFTLSVAIPCMSVYGLTNNLTRDLLVQSGSFLLVPLLGTVVITILSLLVGRLLKLPRKKLGVFMMMCSVSNAIFVGLAMCTELFGDTCTPYVMLYYLINTSFVQLLFLSLVRWSGESRGFDLKMLQKFLTTPAVIAVFVGLALVWFEVRLPSLVMSYCRYMNNLVTPLALLLTGYIIHDIGLKNVRLDRDLGIAMLFRFLLGQPKRHQLDNLLARNLADGGFVNQRGVEVIRFELRYGKNLRVIHDNRVTLRVAGTGGLPDKPAVELLPRIVLGN